jgi:cysteine desulfurase
METDENAIAILRNHLQHLLQAAIPNLLVNGNLNKRLSGN